MPDPKQPCKSCGGGWKPHSRREFLQKAVVLSAGLALSATALTSATPAYAQTFDLADCLHAANEQFEVCLNNAERIPGTGVAARARRIAERAACEIAFDAEAAACYAALAAEVARELAQHAVDHPGDVIVGAVITVIGFEVLITAIGIVIL